jgi:4-hydroxyphenylpyruvate dioxygenase
MKKSLATVTLSGTLREKLEAASAAGFDGVEIFENDLTQYCGSASDVRMMANDLGLEIIALQPFRDMEGMPEPLRTQKQRMLQKKMALAHELGTTRLLMCSNVQSYSSPDRDQCADDLRILADMAKNEGIMLGYEALAWGYHIADYEDAWDIVKRVDHPNLGINLDTFHMYSRGNTLDVLRNEIPVEKIALVQVADAPILQLDLLQYSRHFRCFPGQGDMPVVAFVQALRDKGFDDYLSHEIFNDEFRSSCPKEKAIDGMRSLLWLEEQTHAAKNDSSATSEPVAAADQLPEASINDVEFIEFAVEGETGESLVALLESMGFCETHKHRSKNVSLMRQGEINLILNREPKSLAHEHFKKHGVSVCALAFSTDDLKGVLKRADFYQCSRFANQSGPGELNIPAIRGIDDSLVYFVERRGNIRFFDIDFEPVEPVNSAAKPVLKRIDHIGQTVSNTDFLSAAFFYKSLFNFNIEASTDLPDIYGLVVSRLASSPNGKIRIPINMTEAREASASRFLQTSKGSGVQQIAFESDDVFASAKAFSKEQRLSIPDNYYRDLDARFELDPALLKKMQSLDIMYDQNDQGEFFHFYTRELHGVFFEVLQRVDGYQRYGEANAHIRLASQANEYRKQS